MGLRSMLFSKVIKLKIIKKEIKESLRSMLFSKVIKPLYGINLYALVWEVCYLVRLSNLTSFLLSIMLVWEVCYLVRLSNIIKQ